jgi:hypothetical protein
MSVRNIFGDLTVQGNTNVFQNLTVQGTTTTLYGNIVGAASSTIGNVSVPFGNLFSNGANLTSVNASVVFTNVLQTLNVIASNALATTNVLSTNSNVSGVMNTFSLIFVSNIGIGTGPTGNTLEVSGNVWVSNALSTTNVFVNSSNVGTGNVSSLNFGSNIGVGVSPTGNILDVSGNVYVSNSLTTTNLIVTTLNVVGNPNVPSILVSNSIGLSGANVNVLGNLWVSNSLSTTNVFGFLNLTSANVSTFNVGTLNVSSLFVPAANGVVNVVSISGQVGINTSTGLGAALSVQGNLYASNALTGGNLVASGTINYNEDLFKRGPYLLPSVANSATIQAWISATCNAASQPTKAWWATSPKPIFSNAALGPKGSTDYGGSVLLPDGRVLFVPQNASNVGFYNPATGLFSAVAVSGITAQTNKFRSGVLVPNGNVVFVPWNNSNVGLFNPVTYRYSNIQIGAAAGGGGYRFQGAVLGPTGNVIMVPRDSANIGVFNPTTLSLTNVGPIAGQGLSLFGSGVLLPNGNVVMSPLSTGANIGMYNTYSLSTTGFSNVGPIASSGTWESASLAPNGNVIFPPASSTNVVVYNPTFVSSPISSGGFSNVPINFGSIGGGNYFQGSALLPSGNVVLAPADASNVGMFDPGALQYSNCAPVSALTAKFFGCSLVPDGRVVFVPAASTNVGVLSTLVPAPREFCLSPYFNKF